MIDPHTMTTADVARALGVCAGRVRQLDDVLQPVRRIGSRHRRYDPEVVQRVAESRVIARGDVTGTR